MMKSVCLALVALIVSFASLPSNLATAQTPEGVLTIHAVRVCLYADGTTFEIGLDQECPPYWLDPSNPLVLELVRAKSVDFAAIGLPEPVDIQGFQFLAPPELINEAQQLGLPGVFVEPPFPTPWQHQLIGPGDGAQVIAPQPIPIEPDVPIPLFDPGSEPFFAVDSFFDIAFQVELQIDVLGPDFNPIPMDVFINVVAEPIAPLEVTACRVCQYLDGTTLEIGIDQDCPPFLNIPANVLVFEFVRLKTWNVIVPDVPDDLIVGGIVVVGPNDLVDAANQAGEPLFFPPPFPLDWQIQLIGGGDGLLTLPPSPLPLDPNQPLPLWDPGSLPFEAPILIDSFLDIVPVDPVVVLLDEGLNPLPVRMRLAPFKFGDVNMDGFVNLLDVEPFIQLLSNGQYKLQADINLDGAVNLLDVAGFIDVLSGN